MSATCASCGKPVPDQAVICHLCTGRTRRHLLTVPDLIAELETTALRQANTGDGRGGDAIPWDEHARNTQHAIITSITGWARILHDHDPEAIIWPTPPQWLADNTPTIRRLPWARDLLADLDRVIGAGWRAIDQPERRWYAGPCEVDIERDGATSPCGRALWARADQPEVTCRGCGWIYDVADRRDWLLQSAENLAESAPVIASALTIMLRRRVSPATIRWWASKDAGCRLVPIGVRGMARLYRIGDVLDLVQQPPVPPHQRGELTSV